MKQVPSAIKYNSKEFMPNDTNAKQSNIAGPIQPNIAKEDIPTLSIYINMQRPLGDKDFNLTMISKRFYGSNFLPP